jgi:hypothetical protein
MGFLEGAVGDDLVRVHVRLRAAAGLPDRQGEVIVERAADDLVGGGEDEATLLVSEQAELVVDDRGGLLDEPERGDELARKALAADGEELEAALGLRSPVAARIDLDGAEAVGLDARGHGPLLPRRYLSARPSARSGHVCLDAIAPSPRSCTQRRSSARKHGLQRR